MSARLAWTLAFGVLACGVAACADDPDPRIAVSGSPDNGRREILRLQCGVCHQIPGVRAARGRVGPPLEGFAGRVYLAGKFPNQPERLVAWLRNPPAMAPRTAMPALVQDERVARDIAAYLYTLE